MWVLASGWIDEPIATPAPTPAPVAAPVAAEAAKGAKAGVADDDADGEDDDDKDDKDDAAEEAGSRPRVYPSLLFSGAAQNRTAKAKETYLAAFADSADGAGRLLAEVEMLPLRKAIAEGTLRKDPALARSELFTAPEQANPLVLEPQAVRAIEGFELELVPPSAEQVERLDALLAAEDADHL